MAAASLQPSIDARGSKLLRASSVTRKRSSFHSTVETSVRRREQHASVSSLLGHSNSTADARAENDELRGRNQEGRLRWSERAERKWPEPSARRKDHRESITELCLSVMRAARESESEEKNSDADLCSFSFSRRPSRAAIRKARRMSRRSTAHDGTLRLICVGSGNDSSSFTIRHSKQCIHVDGSIGARMIRYENVALLDGIGW